MELPHQHGAEPVLGPGAHAAPALLEAAQLLVQAGPAALHQGLQPPRRLRQGAQLRLAPLRLLQQALGGRGGAGTSTDT